MEDFFTRCDEWQTGIPALDAQHASLADCIRKIEDASSRCENMRPGDVHSGEQQVFALLDKLYHATKEHFESEEAIMLEEEYPGLAAHRREHIMMLAELKLIIRDVESGENKVNANMARGLRIWFIAHIKLSDCKFSAYISTRQLVLE